MSKTITLTPIYKASALRTAMGYRGVTQTELAKNIKGLSQSNLSKFLKVYFGVLSEQKIKSIMDYLNFPFEFIYIDFKPIQTSNGIIQ